MMGWIPYFLESSLIDSRSCNASMATSALKALKPGAVYCPSSAKLMFLFL